MKKYAVVMAFTLLLIPAGVSAAVVMETVPVGNVGNASDTHGDGYGAVSYEYNIGKYEVTAGQYTEFLNAVAATDTYGLYNIEMWSIIFGCKIQQHGSSGSYTYSVAGDSASRPVNYVSWGDVTRFCNWLNNGQPTGSQGLGTTEDGSYFLSGAMTNAELLVVTREPDATWVIPSEDEWYKAAYHKNDGVTGNYFDYPTSSDSVPGYVGDGETIPDSDPGNFATYDGDGGINGIGNPHYRTAVGEHENSESPYGTFDQGGNVGEWNEETLYAVYREWRGGSFSNLGDHLHAVSRGGSDSTHAGRNVGFRVARVTYIPPDCNSNGVADSTDIAEGTSDDCNSNGIPDECDIDDGLSIDCNSNGVPDTCETDCNANHVPDECDIGVGTSVDYNTNGVPDECDPDCNTNGIPDTGDITAGTSLDCNTNGIPDECDTKTDNDCNNNSIPDECDIDGGLSDDCDLNRVPDECDEDCNTNSIPDACESFIDCNLNNVLDSCDLAEATSNDCNSNGVPDECDIDTVLSIDCNSNGIPDECDMVGTTSDDCNTNGIPDECDLDRGSSDDCNSNSIPDECDIQTDHNCCDIGHGSSCSNEEITACVCQIDSYCCDTDWDRFCIDLVLDADCGSCPSNDLNSNGVPDECDPDCNTNGIPDFVEIAEGSAGDCNSNNVPDECDLAAGTSNDLNGNIIPDECEPNRTWYVDDDAPLGGNGQSWDTAYTYLQDALHSAIEGDVIHVGAGLYKPDEDERGLEIPGDREATFNLVNAVALYGGYAGYGAVEPDSRDIDTNASILSGDLSGDDIPVDLGGFMACYSGWDKPFEPGCEAYDLDNDQDVDMGDLYTFKDNSNNAENSYHVVTAESVDSNGVLDGFTISGGNADRYDSYRDRLGGGMHNHNSSLRLTNCTFNSNWARSRGGGMNNSRSSATLTNCTFNGNWAEGGGGVSTYDSNSTFANCTFTHNIAGEGGGVQISNNYSCSSGPQPTEFSACLFTSNVSMGGGGGLADGLGDGCDKSHSFAEDRNPDPNSHYLRLDNCVFANNKAFGDDGYGGGGLLHYYVPPLPRPQPSLVETLGFKTISTPAHSTFEGRHWPPVHLITNCIFVNNQACLGGGAMYKGFGSTFINCTFTGNSANTIGGGIYTWYSLIVANCILWGNNDSDGFDESAQIRSDMDSVQYSCIQGLDTYAGNNNIGVNPLFVDSNGLDGIPGTEDDDLRLQPGSPCINFGDNTAIPEGVITDFDGLPRVRGCFVDMGAYEYQDDALLGDVDEDCDVDLDDYLDFSFCLERFGYERNPILDACLESFDFDSDGNIDLADFAGFQRAVGFSWTNG